MFSKSLFWYTPIHKYYILNRTFVRLQLTVIKIKDDCAFPAIYGELKCSKKSYVASLWSFKRVIRGNYHKATSLFNNILLYGVINYQRRIIIVSGITFSMLSNTYIYVVFYYWLNKYLSFKFLIKFCIVWGTLLVYYYMIRSETGQAVRHGDIK